MVWPLLASPHLMALCFLTPAISNYQQLPQIDWVVSCPRHPRPEMLSSNSSVDTHLLIFHHPLQYFLVFPPFDCSSCSLYCGNGIAQWLKMASGARSPASESSPAIHQPGNFEQVA